MERRDLLDTFQTFEGEHLKTSAEFSLHTLAKHELGKKVIDLARRGERVEDPRLNITIADIDFENPVMVGAGWDKKGWAIDGLYRLGFSGTEIGSVLLFPQPGNPRPRLFMDTSTRSVGLNRMGFNSLGTEGVAAYLNTQTLPGVVGINISRNKMLSEDQSPWAFAAVATKLQDYADYFVINFMSPNTPGLRTSMMRLLRETLVAMRDRSGQDLDEPPIPIFIKTAVDMSDKDIYDTLQIAIEENAAGIIDSNTTASNAIKARYGWSDEMGGVSGNDQYYQAVAVNRMKLITRLSRGTSLARIGVGGINDPLTALERIEAGAQVIQVVTGIRHRKGPIAQNINKGLLKVMEADGVRNISEYVGIAA